MPVFTCHLHPPFTSAQIATAYLSHVGLDDEVKHGLEAGEAGLLEAV